MKRLFFILLGGILMSIPAFAQRGSPVTESGSTAINFTLNGFSGFGPGGAYIGSTPPGNTLGDSLLSQLNQLVGTRYVRPVYGFGITLYVADGVGLRLGVGANADINTTPRNDSANTEDTKTDLVLGFSTALQIHIATSGSATAYTGLAFSIASGIAWQGADKDRTRDSQLGYGGGILIGAEFYPIDNVSLGLESQFGIEITTTNRTVANKGTIGPSSTNIGFMGPARVTVAFHI